MLLLSVQISKIFKEGKSLRRIRMRTLVVLLIVAALIFSCAPAFAGKGQGPGDGGFFTKLFKGALGDSWTMTPEEVKKDHEAKRSMQQGSN